MPKRFTDSEKWKDPWFRKLPPPGKLLLLFLYDRCDIAGFWEIDMEAAAFEIGYPAKTLVSALKHLESRYETNGKYLWVRRFIEFQGNYPFKDKVRVHEGIIRLLKKREEFSNNITRLLNGEGLPNSYEGLNKGLFNPASNSNSNSNSNSKGKGKGQQAVSYSEDFEKFWAFWLSMGRGQNKLGAWDKWQTCLQGRNGKKPHVPATAAQLLTAGENYKDKCVAAGTQPEYIMLAKTFLGPDQHWRDYLKAKVHQSAADSFADKVLADAKLSSKGAL